MINYGDGYVGLGDLTRKFEKCHMINLQGLEMHWPE